MRNTGSYSKPEFDRIFLLSIWQTLLCKLMERLHSFSMVINLQFDQGRAQGKLRYASYGLASTALASDFPGAHQIHQQRTSVFTCHPNGAYAVHKTHISGSPVDFSRVVFAPGSAAMLCPYQQSKTLQAHTKRTTTNTKVRVTQAYNPGARQEGSHRRQGSGCCGTNSKRTR